MKQILWIIIAPLEQTGAIIRTAESVGTTGGTIIHARSLEPDAARLFFPMGLEPEREVVLIALDETLVPSLHAKISDLMADDDPNQWLIYITDIERLDGAVNSN